MRLAIDTSAYSAFGRGDDSRLSKWFSNRNNLVLPLIVVGELRAGFANGARQEQNERLLQKFLDASNVTIVTVSDKTTRLYAMIYQKLKKAGRPINTNDMWIAALTLEHDCSLVTLDSDFTHIPDLLIAKL